MTYMKPSELPVRTTIEVDGTEWTKGTIDFWYPASAHCVDCRDEDKVSNVFVDEKFAKYELVTVPFGVVWQMAISLGDEYGSTDAEGNPITYYGLVESAIEEHNRVVRVHEEFEAEKAELAKDAG